MNAQCASSHPARAAEHGASPLLSSERSTGPLHSHRLRRPGHRKSDPGASRPTPSSAAADPPGILHRKDRHIQAGGQDGLQERGRGHPGFLARVRRGPPPSAESKRSEECPVEETQRREIEPIEQLPAGRVDSPKRGRNHRGLSFRWPGPGFPLGRSPNLRKATKTGMSPITFYFTRRHGPRLITPAGRSVREATARGQVVRRSRDLAGRDSAGELAYP